VNDGVAEVQMGKPAVEKASNPQVKQFGQSMIDDHTTAGDQLKSVASKDNITLPADLNAKDKATYDSLSKLSGTAFDRAYMRDMVKDHQTDVNEFQKEATSHAARPSPDGSRDEQRPGHTKQSLTACSRARLSNGANLQVWEMAGHARPLRTLGMESVGDRIWRT